MNKLYIAIGFVCLVCAAYGAGMRLGAQKCHTDTAINQNNQLITTQQQIIKIKEEIHAETVTSATDVIRDRLRIQYTIAD